MGIPEKQLEAWSHQGAVKQSRDTYATLKSALEDPKAPYHSRSYTTFLQGSYGNDTNIYADSDVDAVMRLDSIYYSDLEQLPEPDQAAYNAARSGADYDFQSWKQDVVSHLAKKRAAPQIHTIQNLERQQLCRRRLLLGQGRAVDP